MQYFRQCTQALADWKMREKMLLYRVKDKIWINDSFDWEILQISIIQIDCSSYLCYKIFRFCRRTSRWIEFSKSLKNQFKKFIHCKIALLNYIKEFRREGKQNQNKRRRNFQHIENNIDKFHFLLHLRSKYVIFNEFIIRQNDHCNMTE